MPSRASSALVPALFAATIGIAFVLGPLVTAVSWQNYFSDPRTWLFVPLTASLVTHSMTLPGVFDTVPQAGVIDPPLWTLRYEAMCYVLLALFALVGALATRPRASLTLALVFDFYVFVTFATSWRGELGAVDSAIRFILGFFLGGALYVFADKIRLDVGMAVLLALLAIATHKTPFQEITLRLALAYGVLWFALVPAGAIRRFNLVGDYSYGIYILCFPIQQTFVMLDPEITPAWLFVCSFPAGSTSPCSPGTSSSIRRCGRRHGQGIAWAASCAAVNSGSPLCWGWDRLPSRKRPRPISH